MILLKLLQACNLALDRNPCSEFASWQLTGWLPIMASGQENQLSDLQPGRWSLDAKKIGHYNVKTIGAARSVTLFLVMTPSPVSTAIPEEKGKVEKDTPGGLTRLTIRDALSRCRRDRI